MSWLGPASSGVYPHTNGAQCFAGGHRHRIPLTTKGLRVARAAWQAIGEPFAVGGRTGSTEHAWRASARSHLLVPRDRGRSRGTRTRTRRRCALGVPQGVRDTGRAADGGHGSRGTGSVRSLCGRCHWYGAGARPRAWTCRIRPAACLCSRGSDCTTRTGRSCRCAGAWVRRTAGKPALGEP